MIAFGVGGGGIAGGIGVAEARGWVDARSDDLRRLSDDLRFPRLVAFLGVL